MDHDILCQHHLRAGLGKIRPIDVRPISTFRSKIDFVQKALLRSRTLLPGCWYFPFNIVRDIKRNFSEYMKFKDLLFSLIEKRQLKFVCLKVCTSLTITICIRIRWLGTTSGASAAKRTAAARPATRPSTTARPSRTWLLKPPSASWSTVRLASSMSSTIDTTRRSRPSWQGTAAEDRSRTTGLDRRRLVTSIDDETRLWKSAFATTKISATRESLSSQVWWPQPFC